MRISDISPFKYTILEGSDNGKTKIRGVFQRADEKNGNGRIYPRNLWEKILTTEAVKENLNRRRMVGEVDHPMESEIRLAKASHVITGLSLQENNDVIGELEILPTEHGKHLESLFKAGVELGISSRGEGSVVEKNGSEYISEDFNLITFDIVANPSTRGAYPKVVNEEKVSPKGELKDMSNKLKPLVEKAQSLLSVDVGSTTQSERMRLLETSLDLAREFDLLAVEDPGSKSVAESIARELVENRKNILSAGPAMEKKMEASEALIEGFVVEVEKQAGIIREKNLKIAALEKKVATLEASNRRAMIAGDEVLKAFKKESVRNRMESAGRRRRVLENRKRFSKIIMRERKRATLKEQSESKSVTPKKVIEEVSLPSPRQVKRAVVETKKTVDPILESIRTNSSSFRL